MTLMLALISLDSVARPLLDRMIAQGRLPNCAELMRRGKTYEMETTPIHASVYRSLYTGFSLSTHGLHYPFQWCASQQRVRPADPLNPADSIFGRLDRAGRRILVIDPPECGRFQPTSGIAVSGWQFTARLVLPQWYSSKRIWRALKDQLGAPKSCHEVFGQPSLPRLRVMHEILQSAPQRLSDATVACLKEGEFDFLLVTFAAAHIAGHQFWRESLDSESCSVEGEPEVLAGIYQKVDEALGRILAALPPDTDVIVFSPTGMGPETSRADFLPAMLTKVLGVDAMSRTAASPGTALWRLRAGLPTNLRALVANAIPEWLALTVAARLENVDTDWKTTRAFATPSDGPGFVRLNLKGRERNGIVNPNEAERLLDEIAEGLATFVEPFGEKVITSVVRSSDLVRPGPMSASLPDLVVLWSQQPSAGLRRVISPRFGEVVRDGVGSGRSGNHGEGAWACIVPGGSGKPAPDLGPVRAVDLTSTACALMGAPHDDLLGRVLLQ